MPIKEEKFQAVTDQTVHDMLHMESGLYALEDGSPNVYVSVLDTDYAFSLDDLVALVIAANFEQVLDGLARSGDDRRRASISLRRYVERQFNALFRNHEAKKLFAELAAEQKTSKQDAGMTMVAETVWTPFGFFKAPLDPSWPRKLARCHSNEDLFCLVITKGLVDPDALNEVQARGLYEQYLAWRNPTQRRKA